MTQRSRTPVIAEIDTLPSPDETRCHCIDPVFTALENISDAFFVLDCNWRIVFANAMAVHVTGQSRPALLAKSYWEAFPALVGTQAETAYRRALGERSPVLEEHYVSTLDRWFSVKCDPIPTGGLAISFRDNTDERQHHQAIWESEQRFRHLADNISQFAWTADPYGSIYWYNQRWYEYTGTTLKEMQGWGWEKVHHPDHIERVVRRLQVAWHSGEPYEDTYPLRGKDGNYRWFLSRALPDRDAAGNVVCWFGTNTDVTEQRAAEETLKAIDVARNRFIATLAHELRNPLAPLRTGLAIVQLGDVAKDGFQRVCLMMDRQLQHMVRLIDGLLDMSRISQSKVVLVRQPVDLASIIENAVDMTMPDVNLSKHQLAVTLPPQPIYLDADPMRLTQVFANILNNACKYTESGGKGRIVLEAAMQGGEVVVSVKDNGIGIPTAMLSKIFEIFTQVHASLDRTQNGLGIGLSLTQQLVELHGGTVLALSDGPGQGSEFIVRLPAVGLQ